MSEFLVCILTVKTHMHNTRLCLYSVSYGEDFVRKTNQDALDNEKCIISYKGNYLVKKSGQFSGQFLFLFW